MAERSHDSRIYGRRIMLRLDAISGTTLQPLTTQYGTSKTHIIRQLRVQAKPEDFPTSWRTKVAERRAPKAPQASMGQDGTPHL